MVSFLINDFHVLNRKINFFAAAIALICLKIALSVAYFITLSSPIAELRDLTLQESPQKWIDALGTADAGAYLGTALQYSVSGRLDRYCSECSPPELQPFYFWGPGAPLGFGLVFKWFGSSDMQAIFWFVAFLELVTLLISLWILCRLTDNLIGISVGILFLAFNLPFKVLYYGNDGFLWKPQAPLLTASEPPALLFFALGLGAVSFGLAQLWREVDSRFSSILSFAIAGLCFGLSSLVRDSSAQFANFVAVAIVLLVLSRDRKRWIQAITGATLLALFTHGIRYPVQQWNKRRIGYAVVSTSGGTNAIWRYGVWGDYSTPDPANRQWIENSGLGFGSWLEPEVAREIREDYSHGVKGVDERAKKEYLRALFNHPLEALNFKFTRIKHLLFNADVWPASHYWPISIYCMVLYIFLGLHFLCCLLRREWPIEVFYLYPVFIFMAGVLIHFEFRYTFPSLLTLQLIPAYEISRWIEWYSNRQQTD